MSTHAAGLGKLTVTSALGQPLNAEIELSSLQPGEFESLSGKIASPEAYNEARIDYSPTLRVLRFAVDKRANGQAILKVTSIAPVNEPFVDMLVELTWPSGRLTREYPILLDPPGFSEARVNAPAVATVAPPPAAQPAPAAAPAAPVVAATPTPSAPAASPAAAPATPSRPASAPESTATPSARVESGAPADTYGPVKKGDTLRKIADEVKPDSVSLEQMLVALYRENKGAFVDSNMNRLKAGQILRVPSASDVEKVAQGEAQKEIKVQVANWKAYREGVASSVASGPAAADATNQSSGKIAAARPDKPAPPTENKDILKLSKVDSSPAKAGAPGAKGAVGPSAQDQVNALKEEAVARENALREAKSRVSDLEKQIQTMRQLMELKGIAPPGSKPGTAPAPAPAPVAAAKPADTKAPEPVKTAPPADTKVAQVAPAPAKAPDAAKPAEPVKTEPAKAPDAAKTDVAVKPATPPDTKVADAGKPAAKPAAKAPPPPPEPDMMDTVMEYLPIIGGGLGVLVIGGGLFAFMRKRKEKSTAGPLTRTSSILPSDLKPNTTTGKPAGGLIDTGNSSFLTDFDKTGPGTIDTDEVDPVAEAEVYIAYGRDAQAEEILKEAMGRDKTRHEITMKLLEIYHARKSVSAYENVAREFKQNVGETHPLWAKAAAMGAQIDPNNPLYAGYGQDFTSTASMAAVAGTAAVAAEEPKAAAPPDLDFDLGFTDSAKSDAPADETPPPAASDLDFDLNLGPASTPAPHLNAPATHASDGLDFDLGTDQHEPPAAAPAAPPAPAPAAASSSFDFDLSDLSVASPAAPAASPAAEAHGKAPALNLSDISLDLDAPAAAPAASGGDASSAVATKMELAKAYVEIGDSDGAKEILQEVLREGNAAQQQEAKSLIASL